MNTITTPVTSLYSFGKEVCTADSWSESGSMILDSFRGAINGLIHANIRPKSHNASNYVSKAYLDKQGRLKSGVNPAPALTRQWELKSSQLHEEVLRNNGTVGVEVNSQNFYINPAYQGVTYEIEPGQPLVLEDAIIFEPRTLTSAQNQMQMTLYVKSEKAVL